MDVSRLIVFAHGGPGLPEHDSLMVLLPAFPMILIGTIILTGALRKRGLLGADGRMVYVTTAGAAAAATLSTGAAAIHFSVLPVHLAEFAPFGLAFLAVGWFQLIWAQFYLLRPTRGVATAGGLVNAAVAVVWLLSRTVGLPVGPNPWAPESIGLLDLFATAFEIALVCFVLPVTMPARWPTLASQRMAFERAFVLATFCLITVTLLTAYALVGVPSAEAGIQP